MREPLPESVSDEARFVTVTEAIPLLGVSERTVRRYAGQVPDDDRQESAKGPKRYRLSALRKVAGMETDAGQMPDIEPVIATATPDSAGQEETRAQVADLLRRAEVAEARAQLLESERDTLRGALEREQETARLALSQLDQARREYGVMIAATAAGRISPYGASDAPETAQTGESSVSAPLAENRQGTGKNEVLREHSLENTGDSGAVPTPRRWFEFWKK